MPRPCKKRRICCAPKAGVFGPGSGSSNGQIIMALDEYETIRLIDVEGMNQEECALRLGVARTTVQAIYTKARHKIGLALTEGLELVISGGDYQICSESSTCGGRKCHCACGCPVRK